MNKYIKLFLKYLFLGFIGGFTYYNIELMYRGYSHISMFLLASFLFIVIGLINEFLSWDTPLFIQSIIGAIIVTAFEFITGCIVNLWLGLNIWDYSNEPLNVMGQICLPFTFIWIILSIDFTSPISYGLRHSTFCQFLHQLQTKFLRGTP